MILQRGLAACAHLRVLDMCLLVVPAVGHRVVSYGPRSKKKGTFGAKPTYLNMPRAVCAVHVILKAVFLLLVFLRPYKRGTHTVNEHPVPVPL